jgi:RRXRR protein
LAVFVLDQRKRPVMPCCEKRAHLLLERGRAVIHRRYPFMIRLKDRVGGDVEPVRVQLDPGSRITGVAVVAGNKPARVLCLFELAHSGSFRVANADGINAKSCKRRHRADGYCYARQPALAPRPDERGFHRGKL